MVVSSVVEKRETYSSSIAWCIPIMLVLKSNCSYWLCLDFAAHLILRVNELLFLDTGFDLAADSSYKKVQKTLQNVFVPICSILLGYLELCISWVRVTNPSGGPRWQIWGFAGVFSKRGVLLPKNDAGNMLTFSSKHFLLIWSTTNK